MNTELSAHDCDLLHLASNKKIYLTRGRIMRVGCRYDQEFAAAVQRLRAWRLLVLARAVPPVPPTRYFELTPAGREAIEP